MRYTVSILLAVALMTAVVGGCGKRTLTSRIENGIAARLPEVIGPASSYRVEVAGHTGRMIKGKMAQIRIFGEGVEITDELTVDELRVTMDDVVFDKKSETIKSCAATNFQATVKETTFNTYLRAARPDLNELRINLKKDRMSVHLRPAVLKISLGVDVEGVLRVAQPAKVYFEVDRLALAGLKMPSLVADYVEEKINPVHDLSTTGLKVRLSSVSVTPGSVTLHGAADLVSVVSPP